MPYFKKLLFGFLFLVTFTAFHFLLSPLLLTYDWIFGFAQDSATQLLYLALLLLSSALLFVVFVVLCNDRRIGIAVSILGALVPLLFSPNETGLVMVVLFALVLIVNYFVVENNMKNYLVFSPVTLLSPHIKTLSSLILIVTCLGYYLSINAVIKQNGFTLPDSIIPDAVIQQLIDQQTSQLIKGDKYLAQLPTLTPEQIQLLKQNPDLLRQYGVDPAILDQYDSPSNTTSTSDPKTTTSESTSTSSAASKPKTTAVQVPTTSTTTSSNPTVALVKKMALEPINKMIKDYEFLAAPLLALLLFSAISFFFFFFFLFNLISGAILKSIFYILEKTNYIRFEKEMREVKKLVV